MPSVNEFYGSGETLKAADLQGRDCPVTISQIQFREFDDGNKIELSFNGTDKKLILNKTNAQTIADLLGDETNNWVGQQITLFPTQTDYNGRQVACIRVRLNQMQGFQQQAPVQQAQTTQNGATPFTAPPAQASEQILDDSVPF